MKVAGNNLVYYLEAATDKYHNEKLLINKQMIKTGIEDIPALKGLKEAIEKKQTLDGFLTDLQEIHKVYAQSVSQEETASYGDDTTSEEKVKGKSSTELDTAYLAAVEAGDMETAQRMVDEAAKKAGYRVEYMYRGGHSNHNILLPANQREDAEYAEPGNLGCGIYFTPDRAYAERFGKVQKFYLKYSKAADITNDEAVKKVLRDIENGFYWDADEGSPDYELYDTGGSIC